MEAFKEFEEEETSTTDSKVITEFRIVPTDSHREQFLDDYHHCCLCGSELVFTHNTNFIALDVKEEAFCPSCNIRTKQNDHRLH